MTPEDALRDLAELPETPHVTVAKIEPTDVIVIESPGALRPEIHERLRVILKNVWPNNVVLVLDNGLQMKVCREVSA